MEKKDIKEILEKVSSGTFSPEEEETAKRWLFQLHREDEAGLTPSQISASRRKVWEILQKHRQPQPVKSARLWPRIATVAAAVALIILGVYFFRYSNPAINGPAALVQDIAPGKQGATLTLASGKQIRLSDASNGELAKEAGVLISKSADGQLAYEITNSGSAADKINTLSTANGETYQLRLPDGTLVWLNAASSLTYAASLMENGKRTVKLTGEGYFQVAKDQAHPFIVESKGQQLEVLGTRFNISAYSNDPVSKTTLAEGSVKIGSGTATRILKPNQQATVSGQTIEVKEIDAEYALAWKDGYFLFNDESLESIMTRVARWYNVDVEFLDESIKTEAFIGTISRFEKISEVFKMLEKTRVAVFRLEGKKVIIDKKK